MTAVLRVARPGAYTTVQDAGRVGYQHLGVPVSGALDPFAHRVANLLVGNPPDRAVLEITILGPEFEVLAPVDLAVAGAELDVRVGGEAVGTWRSFRAGPGDVVSVGQATAGCRAYLAVTGGLDVPVVMGSRSTYVGGAVGGLDGRPLRAGDELAALPGAVLDRPRELPDRLRPAYPGEVVLRAVRGPQDEFFDVGFDRLFGGSYLVTPKADRMGYRLQGEPVPLAPGRPRSIVSEPSVPGGVQIPPDEQPIVLLVEQTVGGYAKIATVVSPDLARLAQATPGDRVVFEEVDLAAAHGLYREAAERLREIEHLW